MKLRDVAARFFQTSIPPASIQARAPKRPGRDSLSSDELAALLAETHQQIASIMQVCTRFQPFRLTFVAALKDGAADLEPFLRQLDKFNEILGEVHEALPFIVGFCDDDLKPRPAVDGADPAALRQALLLDLSTLAENYRRTETGLRKAERLFVELVATAQGQPAS